MSSTGIDVAKPLSGRLSDEEKTHARLDARQSHHPSDSVSVAESPAASTDHTARRLKSRHIQLIGIGGTIGTALYVQIGRGLLNGGPASLFLAFSLWYFFLI